MNAIAIHPKGRDWQRVLIGHLKVAALCPLVVTAVFWILSEAGASPDERRTAAGFIETVASAYLFFGVVAVLAAFLGAPIVWGISRFPHPLLGRAVAFILGGALGWFMCQFSANETLAFQLALAGTAALAGAALENLWRRTAPVIDVSHG